MGTPKDLTITSWLREREDLAFVLAVPGLKLTGWWPAQPPKISVFGEIKRIWPEETIVALELDILEDDDGGKHQVCAYVRIRTYPEHWLEAVRDSLKIFVDCGAAISWAGGWECFLHYTPAQMFAGCYAAYTDATGLVCSGDLDASITYLSQVPSQVPEAANRLHTGVADAITQGRRS